MLSEGIDVTPKEAEWFDVQAGLCASDFPKFPLAFKRLLLKP
jgi:hypothetical protein